MTPNNGERVFIANYSGHDYEKLKPYGAIEYVTQGYVSFGSLDRVKYRIAESLRRSKADDWLALSGRSIICVLSALVWIGMHGKVKLLVWDDKRGGKYREMIITGVSLHELIDSLEASETA